LTQTDFNELSQLSALIPVIHSADKRFRAETLLIESQVESSQTDLSSSKWMDSLAFYHR